ncbi:hypothetical protein [Myxacorys almedinensis]|uniref:Uncharacterized protein n=1 Tax=Myxacorys almedinensis A TaxID=2690445 RepID=A0A8J7Z1V3_9CYAN|nr:hypothetical protein [Myxacorys almedinensis]NDJ18822.1 hypothetical protein [Myxacorys almedinensis A]
MSTGKISATLNDADQAAVMDAITTIKEKLPFLLSLTVDQRKALPKMGDKNQPFAHKALEVASQNSDFLPRSFDLEEMRRDVELLAELYPIMVAMTQLQSMIDDTYLKVGSEAYSSALQVYTYAKASGQGSGLEPLVAELGQRFARRTKREKSQPTTV